jgi:hypothetical protein
MKIDENVKFFNNVITNLKDGSVLKYSKTGKKKIFLDLKQKEKEEYEKKLEELRLANL